MWKSLLSLAILANILIIVSSIPDSVYVVTVTSNASPIRVDCKEQIFDAASDAQIGLDKGKVKDKHTIITTITKASSNSTADVTSDSGNTSVSAGAGAAASVTTIVKTHVHTMKKCASHEKYVKCPKKLCQPQNCEEVGVLVCSKEKHQQEKEEKENHEEESKEAHRERCGTPACFCIDDYVRIHGICRPVTECTECGGDKNATVGCGVNCGRRCSNYMKKDISCPDTDFICYENSCDCKDTYVFDDNTGKCVLPEDCSNKNAPNPGESEGTPGSGEPGDGGEPCDSCNGDCAEQDNTDDEESEDGNSKQNKCTTKNPKEEESTDGTNEGITKDMTTTEKPDKMSTSHKETGNETEEPETTTDQPEMNTEAPKKTTDQSENGTKAPETTMTHLENGTEAPEEGKATEKEKDNTEENSGGKTEACSGDPNAKPGCDKECKNRCPGDKHKTCSCPEKSCQCKEGYVYSFATFKCVKPEECGSGMTEDGTEESTKESTTKKNKNTDMTTESMSNSGDNMTTTSEEENNTEEPKATTDSTDENVCPEDPDTNESKTTSAEKNTKNPNTSTSQFEYGNCGSESETTETTEEPEMETTTKKKHKSKKHKTTITMSPCAQKNTEDSDNNESETTEEPEMESTTKKKHKTKKHKTTTASPNEATNSEDPEQNESETTEEPEMESTTKKKHNTKKHKTTTALPNEAMNSKDPEQNESETTEEPEMESTTKKKHNTKKHKTTTASPNEATNSEDPEQNESETTEESEMESTTKKKHKTKKHKTTTASPNEATNSEDSEQNETTEEPEMESTTKKKHNTKKHKTTTASPIKATNSEDPEQNESETTEESEMESTTKKKHKTKKHKTSKTATTDETTNPEDPKENESKMTSAEPEMTPSSMTAMKTKEPATNHKTKKPDKKETESPTKHPATEDSTTKKSKRTTMSSYEESKETTASEVQSTTETTDSKSTTMKQRRSRKPRTTTTVSPTEEMSTTRRPRRSRKPTTTSSGEEHTKSTKDTDEESKTKAPSKPGSETTEGTATEECNGRHERQHECASECPDHSCGDYLNHNTTRCHRRHRSKNCKPGCRCRNGHYRNSEGKCVTGAHCRREARSTTTASGTTKGGSSSTEMMSTVQHSETCEEEALQIFIRTNLGFTAKILAERSMDSEDGNVLVGGASILFLFGELALFATGESRNQLMDVLGLDSDQIKCFLPRLSANVTLDFSDVEFDLTCNVVADDADSCALTDEFKNTTEEIFHIPPQNLNFSDENSAMSLNDMVADVTGMENFVTFEELSSLSSLVLYDAEMFKGEWMKPFDPRETTELDFHGSDGKVKKPMMHQSGKFLYTESESLGCRVLKMKYKGGDFTLAIFLPNSVDGLEELVQKLSNVDDVVSTLDSLRLMHVDVYIPKFNQITSSRLKMPTTKANVDRIFSEDSTGLQDVSSCEKPYVSDILQTVSYVVDETGTGEPSNADSNSSSDDPSNPHQRAHTTTFKADHPFAYYVIYRKIIIFGGTYAN